VLSSQHTGPASEVARLLASGHLHEARALVHRWLQQELSRNHASNVRTQLRNPALWAALADVVERTSDQALLERFWQHLDSVCPPPSPPGVLPLLGVPILNRIDLLHRLLDSLDVPVATLAIVDNSPAAHRGGPSALQPHLQELRQRGHPLIGAVEIARPFGNLGVASSWNHILSAFADAPLALLANNDVCFAPGVLAAALQRIDTARAQFLPLLPGAQEFSAFLITALTWNRIGLFDEHFYPAYHEDLEYRDRLRADPSVEVIDGSFCHGAMTACNREASATIGSDPRLAAHNQASFAMNRLWYLSHRRLRDDPRGSWVRRWLAQWTD
jgi:hypothetical protein